MPSEATQEARPRRLARVRGDWTLEMVRLVAVERGVFQPFIRHVRGVGPILQALEKHGHEGLASRARELVAGAAESTSYDVVDEEWVPSRVTPEYARDLSRRAGAGGQGGRVALMVELRAELVALRAAYERLQRRVTELERSTPSRAVLPVGAPVLTGGEVRIQEATAAHDTPAVVPEPQASAPPPAEPGARLAFPSARALSAVFRQLAGPASSWIEIPAPDAAEGLPDPAVVAVLSDAAGRDLGAFVIELRTGARLAATLTLAPQESVDAAVASGRLPDDLTTALAELVTALAVTVSEVPGNPPVIARPPGPPTAEVSAWLALATQRFEVADSESGRIVLVARW